MTIYTAKDFKAVALAFFCDSIEVDDEGNIVKVNVHPKPGYVVAFENNKPVVRQKDVNPFDGRGKK